MNLTRHILATLAMAVAFGAAAIAGAWEAEYRPVKA